MKHKKAILLVCSLSFATASIGYSHWINSYTYSYKENNKKQHRPVAYIIGREDIKYTSIEKALDVAQSGDIVTVIPPTMDNYNSLTNKITPDKMEYMITRNCTIKPGVTLVLPTDKQSVVDVSTNLNSYLTNISTDNRNRNGSFHLSGNQSEKLYLRVTVKLADNVTLTNQGNLVVSGELGGGNNSSGKIGQTTHSYSKIILGNNSKIVQNNPNAKLYCYGFIEEINNANSSIELNSGVLYTPIVIFDYRGFPFSAALTDGALSLKHCSPFNDFGFENISSKLHVSYNSRVIAISNLYMKYTNPDVEQNFRNEIGIIGTGADNLLQLNNSSYSKVDFKFNKLSNVYDLNVYGGAVINNFNLTLKPNAMISVDLSTVDSFLPVSYRYNISLNKSSGQAKALFDFTKQRIKLLPGSVFKVNEGVEIQASEFIVYSAFYDGEKGSNPLVKFGSPCVYPLKESAKCIFNNGSNINANSFAGIVYCDNQSQINATTKSIVSNEPWNLKSSGKVKPPRTIHQFLEIREKTKIVPINYLNKYKLSVGSNVFNLSNGFLPRANISSGSLVQTINETQDVLFYDTITDYKIELLSNIYRCYKESVVYNKNETVNVTKNETLIGIIGSSLAISNNNNGINEFNIQSISVKCVTPLDQNNNIPLYPNTSINLEADVVDINKIYNKTIKWSSSDESIATIDSTGKVTGKTLGDVIFYAECDGKRATFPTKVIPKIESTPITLFRVYDTGNTKNTGNFDFATTGSTTVYYPNKYGNNQTITLRLETNAGSRWSSIKWKLTPSQAGRQNIINGTNNELTNVETIQVKTESGTGKSDDEFTLQCDLTDGSNNKTYTLIIKLIHKADISCVLEGTLILMADGSYKKVEEIKCNDLIYIFDHNRGVLKKSKVLYNHKSKEADGEYGTVLNLEFTNNTNVSIFNEHAFFNVTKQKYSFVDKHNYYEFIGDEFVLISKDLSVSKVKLLKVNIEYKKAKYYSIVTYDSLNCITNNLLSLHAANEGWANYFEFDKDMKYNPVLAEKDISLYGLYDYSEFKDYISEEAFELMNIKYLKLSVVKGLTTKDDIVKTIKKYLSAGDESIFPK